MPSTYDPLKGGTRRKSCKKGGIKINNTKKALVRHTRKVKKAYQRFVKLANKKVGGTKSKKSEGSKSTTDERDTQQAKNMGSEESIVLDELDLFFEKGELENTLYDTEFEYKELIERDITDDKKMNHLLDEIVSLKQSINNILFQLKEIQNPQYGDWKNEHFIS